MSNTAETTTNFKRVKMTDNENQGELIIVRPSLLAKEGITGVVAEGNYEGSIPNKFNETQLDHKVRATNGDLYIINGSGGLTAQFKRVELGMLVQVQYNGKKKLTKGKLAGKMVHDFTVLTAADDDGSEG